MTEQLAPDLLQSVLMRNIRRLRIQHGGLSQRTLSLKVRAQGIRDWAPDTIAMIETGKRRCDRLGEIAALCAVFSVTVGELIANDEPVRLEAHDQVKVSTNTITLALDGKMAPPAIVGLADLDTLDRYDAERQAAQALGLELQQFKDLVEDVHWMGGSFVNVRDRRAGMTIEMAASSARARRGHATRELLVELKEVLDRDGIDAIVSRIQERRAKAGRVRLKPVGRRSEVARPLNTFDEPTATRGSEEGE